MSTPMSFSQMLGQLQVGSEAAAAAVFRRYADRLVGLVRRRLNARTQVGFSASDVVQEAMKSFFRRQRERPFDLDNEDALWGLLARLTLYKCGKMQRAVLTQKRGGGRVLSLSPEDSAATAWEVVDEEPTPEEASLCEDLLAQLLDGLGEVERRICQLRLEGHKIEEIASDIDLTQTTVNRKMREIRQRLLELCEAS